MKFGNCLVWAVYQKIRFGGTIESEPSKHGWWRHYYHQPHNGKPPTEFVPLAVKKDFEKLPLLLRIFPVHIILFSGVVRIRT